MLFKTFQDSDLKLIDYSVQLQRVAAYFTTINGGVSTGDYTSLNLSKASGDNPQNVDQNMQILLAHLPKKPRHLYARQVHGVDIFVDDGHLNGCVGDYDGLISDKSDVILSTYHADCVPVYATVKDSSYFGVVHSGWKGTYGEIAKHLVWQLSSLSAKPISDINVVIGAAIDGDSYEVSQSLAEDFKQKFGACVVNVAQNLHYLDLKRAIATSLLSSGIQNENLYIDSTSTYKRKDLLFSYRRQGQQSGRMMTIMLQD